MFIFFRTVQLNNFILRFKVGCFSHWTLKSIFCYHQKFAMVFRGTITIEWNGQRQPLTTMVFRWFWVSQPLVTMVFRWLATIAPTMEWLHTIVEVYLWWTKHWTDSIKFKRNETNILGVNIYYRKLWICITYWEGWEWEERYTNWGKMLDSCFKKDFTLHLQVLCKSCTSPSVFLPSW